MIMSKSVSLCGIKACVVLNAHIDILRYLHACSIVTCTYYIVAQSLHVYLLQVAPSFCDTGVSSLARMCAGVIAKTGRDASAYNLPHHSLAYRLIDRTIQTLHNASPTLTVTKHQYNN